MHRPLPLLLLAIAALALGSAPLRATADEANPEAAGSKTGASVSRPADARLTTKPIPVPAGIDPTSETAPPPLAITGPEDMDVAIELAKDIKHPNYTSPIRYHRSTHISFPLHSIDGSDMSQASVPNAIQLDKKGNDTLQPLEEIDQKLSNEQIKPTEVPKVGAPDTLAGMSIAPSSTPTHLFVESHY